MIILTKIIINFLYVCVCKYIIYVYTHDYIHLLTYILYILAYIQIHMHTYSYFQKIVICSQKSVLEPKEPAEFKQLKSRPYSNNLRGSL